MMVAEKMVELGTKKSTIRTIFEFGQKRAQEVGREWERRKVWSGPALIRRGPDFY